MTSKSISEQKGKIRREYKQRRLALTTNEVRSVSEEIAEHFFQEFDLANIKVIHSYIPIPGKNEVDTAPILGRIKKNFPNIQIVYPDNRSSQCTSKNNMYIDILIVPLICFDKQGNRLGFGGGYYDRLIKSLRKINSNCKVVGLAYDASLYNGALPSDNNDQKLDYIITESRTYGFRQQ